MNHLNITKSYLTTASSEIFSQLVRKLMFPKDNKSYRKSTKSIAKITNIINNKYTPQLSPEHLSHAVTKEYHSWIEHNTKYLIS